MLSAKQIKAMLNVRLQQTRVRKCWVYRVTGTKAKWTKSEANHIINPSKKSYTWENKPRGRTQG